MVEQGNDGDGGDGDGGDGDGGDGGPPLVVTIAPCDCRPTAMVTAVHNCLRKGLTAKQKYELSHP